MEIKKSQDKKPKWFYFLVTSEPLQEYLLLPDDN